MNLDQLKGNWKQVDSNLKSKFEELTGDEVMQIERDAESLSGIVPHE